MTDIEKEIAAIKTMRDSLSGLSPAGRSRAFRYVEAWLVDFDRSDKERLAAFMEEKGSLVAQLGAVDKKIKAVQTRLFTVPSVTTEEE